VNQSPLSAPVTVASADVMASSPASMVRAGTRRRPMCIFAQHGAMGVQSGA